MDKKRARTGEVTWRTAEIVIAVLLVGYLAKCLMTGSAVDPTMLAVSAAAVTASNASALAYRGMYR